MNATGPLGVPSTVAWGHFKPTTFAAKLTLGLRLELLEPCKASPPKTTPDRN